MLLSLALELAYVGLVAEYLVPSLVLSPPILVATLGVLVNCASSFVTMHFMGLNEHRVWPRWNWTLLLLSVGSSALAWNFQGNFALQGLSLLNLVQILSNFSMLIWARLRGFPLRQWMALLMLTNFGMAFLRVGVRQVYVSPETYEWFANSVMLVKAALVLSVIALVAIKQRQEPNAVRERLRLAEQRQLETLQTAVEQKTAELQKALVEANEANRAKIDFLARVSHDLRSPLTAITGYAQLLERVSGRTGQTANTIRRSADHMLAMINDLIEYASGSNSERAKPWPVYIHSWLDGLVREGKALAHRRNNRFTFDLQSELPPVLVLDIKRLHQVVNNLLDNAAKFTQNGEVALIVRGEPLVSLDGAPDRLELIFDVRDTGRGIEPADQVKLFEPFYRAGDASDVQGVGLGLSIVKTWVERLGGSIAVTSQPGHGSTFTVRLPVEMGSEADLAPNQLQDDSGFLPELDGGGRLIWVVEDNDDIRNLLEQELRACGFGVMTSSDGLAFLEQAQAGDAPVPSLVLTDYLMPKADGAAVLRGVRSMWSSVPVVLLSATHMVIEPSGAAGQEAFDAYLTKPVNLMQLRTTLARVLGMPVGNDGLITMPGGLDDLKQPQTTTEPRGVKPLQESRPPEAELRQVCQWVDMGAWSDLTEWVEMLPKRYPACSDFGRRMALMLAQARFEDIRALCAEDEQL